MTPRRYSLCQKPAIGLLLFLASQCVFPPLFDDAPIALAEPGAVVTKAVEVAVPLGYRLQLRTHFANDAARVADSVIGGYVDGHCDPSPGPRPAAAPAVPAHVGAPIRFRVEVVDRASGKVRLDQEFQSLCSVAHGGDHKIREIAVLALAPGTYNLTITAPDGEPGLAGTRSFLALVPPRSK